MPKITDLPPEVIALIVSFLPSSNGKHQLPDPQMIRNLRLIYRLSDKEQAGLYKALIKRYDPTINWMGIESRYNKTHLLPFSQIYELFYRKMSSRRFDLSGLDESVWLYKTLPDQTHPDALIGLLLSAIKIGNLELCQSILLTHELSEFTELKIKQMLNTAFEFNHKKIVQYILQRLSADEKLQLSNIIAAFYSYKDRSEATMLLHDNGDNLNVREILQGIAPISFSVHNYSLDIRDILLSVMLIKDLALLQSLLAKYMPNWVKNINYVSEILSCSLECVYEEGALYILKQLDQNYQFKHHRDNIAKLLKEVCFPKVTRLGFINILQELKSTWKVELDTYDHGYFKGILYFREVALYKNNRYQDTSGNYNGIEIFIIENRNNLNRTHRSKGRDYEQLFRLYGNPTADQYYVWFVFLSLKKRYDFKPDIFSQKMYALFGLPYLSYKEVGDKDSFYLEPEVEIELLNYLLARCSEAALKNLLVTNINNITDTYLRLSISNEDKRAVQEIKDVLLGRITQEASDINIRLLMDMAYRCQQTGNFQKHLTIIIDNLLDRYKWSDYLSYDKESILSILNHIANHYLSDLTPQHKEDLMKLARKVDEVALIEAFEVNPPAMKTAAVASTRSLR